MIKKTKFAVIMIMVLLMSVSCITTRYIAFSGKLATAQTNHGTSVEISGITAKAESIRPKKIVIHDSSTILKNRLAEHLKSLNVDVASGAETNYLVKGNILIKEKQTVNALIIPSVLILLALFPVGTFIAFAFNSANVWNVATADIVVINKSTGEKVFEKHYEEIQEVQKLNGYATDDKGADDRINIMISDAADKLFGKIAADIATATK